jgi:type I protein arginine methyltransferase
MIEDSVRTGAYRRAILQNRELFKDKVVIDVGAGTGILAYFCVLAGAKKVYAIEASSMADWAQRIMEQNGLADRIIVIKGRVEEVELPDDAKEVDIIVSEWMGYFLLYESMFDSVAFARDKWLRPDGYMFPTRATLHFGAMTDPRSHDDVVDFWKDVYGLDMSMLTPFAKKCGFEEPIVDCLYSDSVTSKKSAVIYTFDCMTAGKKNTEKTADEASKMEEETKEEKDDSAMSTEGNETMDDEMAEKDGEKDKEEENPKSKKRMVDTTELDAMDSTFHLEMECDAVLSGFVGWFTVEFPGNFNVVLSTSPFKKETHWKQTLFYFYEPMTLREGTAIEGNIHVRKSREHQRLLDIEISCEADGKKSVQSFIMR